MASSPRLLTSYRSPNPPICCCCCCSLANQTWKTPKKGSPAGTFAWTQKHAPPCIRTRSRKRPRQQRRLPRPTQQPLRGKTGPERDAARERGRTTVGTSKAASTRKPAVAATPPTLQKAVAQAATTATIVVEAPRATTDVGG